MNAGHVLLFSNMYKLGNKAYAIATHRVAKACMNSIFKIFIPLLYYLQDIHTILQNIA